MKASMYNSKYNVKGEQTPVIEQFRISLPLKSIYKLVFNITFLQRGH